MRCWVVGTRTPHGHVRHLVSVRKRRLQGRAAVGADNSACTRSDAEFLGNFACYRLVRCLAGLDPAADKTPTLSVSLTHKQEPVALTNHGSHTGQEQQLMSDPVAQGTNIRRQRHGPTLRPCKTDDTPEEAQGCPRFQSPAMTRA